MTNPFTPGLASSRLIGRASELSDACAQIRNEGHFAISGISGSGKTSFLHALEEPKLWMPQGTNVSDGLAVFLDLSNYQPFRPAEFWTAVRDEFANKLHIHDALREQIAKSDATAKGVEAACKSLRARGKRIVLLLDGYDNASLPNGAYSADELLTHLFETRRLAQARCFATVTATYRRLNDLGPPPEKLQAGASPWYNQYLFQPIGNLPEIECDQFHSMLAPLNIPGVWRKALYELCGGCPALHQHAGHILFDSVSQQTLPPIQEFWDRLESATRHYYKIWWNSATETERLLMKLVAVSELQNRRDLNRDYDLRDLPVIFSQNDRQLRELCERGLLRKRTSTAYGFCSSMMEWWVLREVENTPAADAFGDREKDLLNLSKAQVKAINGAFAKVWQYKDTIKSVITWAAKLFA